MISEGASDQAQSTQPQNISSFGKKDLKINTYLPIFFVEHVFLLQLNPTRWLIDEKWMRGSETVREDAGVRGSLSVPLVCSFQN